MSDADKLRWLMALIACPFLVLLMPSEEVGES